MFDISDLNYARTKLNEKTAKLSTPLAGALGGAGLGLITQAIRPKDKDQNKIKEYILSALLGAGLGAASGYAYDTWKGHGKKTTDTAAASSAKKEDNKDDKADKKPETERKSFDGGGSAAAKARREEERKAREHRAKLKAEYERTGQRGSDYGIYDPAQEVKDKIELALTRKLKTGEPVTSKFNTLDYLERNASNWDEIFDDEGRPRAGVPFILTDKDFETMFPADQAVKREARMALAPYVWNSDPSVRPTPVMRVLDDSDHEIYWPTYISKEGYVVPLDNEELAGKPLFKTTWSGNMNTLPNRSSSWAAEKGREIADWAASTDAGKFVVDSATGANVKKRGQP